MLKLIIVKELRDTFKSLRFSVGVIVMLTLTMVSVFLLSTEFAERHEQYLQMERNAEKFISQYAHPNRAGWIFSPYRPQTWTEVYFRGVDNPDAYTSFFANDLRRILPHLDLLTIVSLLVSLLAIMFSHDAICGEREAGTLKMLHANPVGRRTVILGKLIGLWAAAAAPFLMVYLVAILAGAVLTGIGIGLEQWLVLGLIALAMVVYIGFFTGLGVLVSSLVRHSGTSVLVLLFLWTLFTMVIPNASPIIASEIVPLPSVNAIQNETARIENRVRDERIKAGMQEIEKKLRAEYAIPNTVQNLDIADNLKAIGWPDEKINEFRKKFEAVFMPLVKRVNEEQQAQSKAIWDELHRKVELQSDLARGISLLSPTATLTYFTTDASDLGILAEKDYARQVEEYYKVLMQFVTQRWESEQKRLGITIDYEDFLDMSGYPRFQMQPVAIPERLNAILPWAGHLLVMLMLTAVFGVFAYQRYDIR